MGGDNRARAGLAVYGVHHLHHPLEISLSQIGAGGEAEAVPEERLCHAAAHACAGGEDGLHGAWVPDRKDPAK